MASKMASSTDPTDAEREDPRKHGWVEPPLRPPAPSFMEYPHLEIMRHGVLGNMEPLGTMPNAKLKKSIKAEGSRRVTLVRMTRASASAASTPRAVTPEPEYNPSRRASDAHAAAEEEWNPTTPVAQTKHTAPENTSRHSIRPHSTSFSTSVSPSKYRNEVEREPEWLDRAVEIAWRTARTAGRLHTAYALQTLFLDHRSNSRIIGIIESVATQEATKEELAEFRSLMHYKKKEGRENQTAQKWFAQNDKFLPTTPLRFLPVNFVSPSTKAAAEISHDPASRSPHKASSGHVHKRHKGNDYDSQINNAPETNGNGTMENGVHPRTRSASVLSTDSDLSSLDEELLGGNRDNFGTLALSPNQATTSHANNETTSHAASTADPLARNHPPMTRQRALGPKLHAWDTTTNPTATSSITTSMPPTISTSLVIHKKPQNTTMRAPLPDPFASQLPASKSPPPSHQNAKSLKKAANASSQDLDVSERTLRLKRKAREITENSATIHDSFERHQIEPRGAESEADAATHTTRSGQVLRFRSSQAIKRLNDESDDLSSPTLLSFQPDAAPSSSSNSRAGTPGALHRPTKKPKSGLRMKTSPMKKKAGPSAGIPRASGERYSPIGNGALPHNQDENDDYCSSCGGNGELVCCDGCPRSFHFKCVDPPLSENQLPDNWFCNVCKALRNPPSNGNTGAFGALITVLEKKNPSAFHLPKDIREYFEGVRTGAEGEYEESVAQKPKRNTGYEETPDYLKLKDSKGNFILCNKCNKGAGTSNMIIPCSYCGLNWHLDCLDPPLANPPHPGKQWRCPCHVDDLLGQVAYALGPAHRFRKIKGAAVIKPAIPRGFKNSGHIEVELAPSDDEDEGFFDYEFGRVYRLPEEGIKLDFITRIHNQVRRLATASPTVNTPAQEDTEARINPEASAAANRSLDEQQAALNLLYLSREFGAGGDSRGLVDELISQAPPAVVRMMANGDPSNILKARKLSPNDRQMAIALRALLDKSLADGDGDDDETVAVKTEREAEAMEEAPASRQEGEGSNDVEMLL